MTGGTEILNAPGAIFLFRKPSIKNSRGYFKAKPYEHVLSNFHNGCKNQFNRLAVAWPFSEKTTEENNFFVNGQPITRWSSHTSSQAMHTVKPQKKIAEDVSRSSRMTTCFWIPIMVAKTNSNLNNTMSSNLSFKE